MRQGKWAGMGGDDAFRRYAVLAPLDDGVRVVGLLGAWAAGAVHHARDHEHAEEVCGRIRAAHGGLDGLEVGDGALGTQGEVVPALVDQEFAAPVAELG